MSSGSHSFLSPFIIPAFHISKSRFLHTYWTTIFPEFWSFGVKFAKSWDEGVANVMLRDVSSAETSRIPFFCPSPTNWLWHLCCRASSSDYKLTWDSSRDFTGRNLSLLLIHRLPPLSFLKLADMLYWNMCWDIHQETIFQIPWTTATIWDDHVVERETWEALGAVFPTDTKEISWFLFPHSVLINLMRMAVN